MAGSVQSILWQTLFYVLGAIGLFAIGALPLRACMLIHSSRADSRPTWRTILLLVAALAAAALATQFLLNLAKCLLGYHCSANAAGGWINAAFIGVIYVCFEVMALAIRRLGRRSVAA